MAMGLPTTLHEVGINEEHFDIMAEKASKSYREVIEILQKKMSSIFTKKLYKNKKQED